jgi:hypothetical protein
MTIETIYIERLPFGPERYIGDGLYAAFNGEMLRLRAPRADGDHEVFLDGDVFQELEQFAKQCFAPSQ